MGENGKKTESTREKESTKESTTETQRDTDKPQREKTAEHPHVNDNKPQRATETPINANRARGYKLTFERRNALETH